MAGSTQRAQLQAPAPPRPAPHQPRPGRESGSALLLPRLHWQLSPSLCEPKSSGKGKQERAGTEVKKQFTAPQAPVLVCVHLLVVLTLFLTPRGEERATSASPVPVPSFLRSEIRPWSRGSTLFSIPLLLLASSCACPQVCLHPSSSFTFPVLRVFPGGETEHHAVLHGTSAQECETSSCCSGGQSHRRGNSRSCHAGNKKSCGGGTLRTALQGMNGMTAQA